jgi:phenylacetate-CoA ligase
MKFQTTFLRYAPLSVQNLALSAAGFRLHRFRYTPYFHTRLADLESTAHASLDELLEIQRRRLAARIEWARTYVPWYRDLPPPSERRDAAEAIADTLASIPPFEKSAYAVEPQRFIGADRPRSRLVKNNTSGTTGTALEFWHTREALAEEYATVWRLYRRYGVGLDDPRVTFGGNIIVPFEANWPPFWRTNHFGHQTFFSTYHMKPENLGLYVTALHKTPVRWVQGYPSSLYVMARALLDAGRPLPRGRLAGVFTSSERLLATHREVIETAFNAPVADRYGTSEFAVSMTCCEQNRLHVDMEFCIVEVEPLEDNDDWVRGAILVTGLAPDAIAFFRYRIGDVGTLSKRPCPCGRPGTVFLDVEGREDDYVLTPDGRLIGRLDHLFKGQTQIAEAQILQTEKERITVRIVPRLGYDEADERSLLREIRDRLGAQIETRIEKVREIPREHGGKFRAVKSMIGSLRTLEQRSARLRH